MGEYIDRAELVIGLQKEYETIYGRRPDFYLGYQVACEYVENFQLANVAPVRRGQWNADGRCTRCGSHAPFYAMASSYHKSPYCFECGARMEGGADDDA